MAFSGAAQFAALTLFRDTYCRFDRGHLLAWCLEFDALWALCCGTRFGVLLANLAFGKRGWSAICFVETAGSVL
jgi:hypothetical protein